MGGVRGILLNSSVMFASDDDENEDTTLRPGADYLLRKLRYSKTHYAKYVAARGISSIFSINKLEELLLIICNMNKKASGKDTMTMGYVMKRSWEEDFAKVDAILHKETDEIMAVEMGSSAEFAKKNNFTRNMEELQRYIECQSGCCVIDPFSYIHPVLDRHKIQQILLGLENLKIKGHCKIRCPHFLKVDCFNETDLEQRLVEAKLPLPNMVKPQVACGVADAHSMAIVFKVNDYKDLDIPFPAVVQEYVDHSSLLYKFYTLEGKIYYAVKKSTPNADTLTKLSEEQGLEPLFFDSLKSLPIAKENPQFCDQHIYLGLVTDAADWLRRILGLTIFGFDVVVEEGTGDHVIVDVNHFPSFKEVPDDIAIPAFWEAVKEKIDLEKSNNLQKLLDQIGD